MEGVVGAKSHLRNRLSAKVWFIPHGAETSEEHTSCESDQGPEQNACGEEIDLCMEVLVKGACWG